MEASLVGTPALSHPSVIFSNDANAFAETPSLMVGRDLLVIPVVLEGASEAVGLVPTGLWYSLDEASHDAAPTSYSPPSVRAYLQQATSNLSFPCKTYDSIPALQKAGSIVPLHNQAAMLVQDTKASGYRIVVAMDQTYHASGVLRLDTDDNPLNETNTYAFQYTAEGSLSKGSLVVSPLPSSNQGVASTPDMAAIANRNVFPQLFNHSTVILQFPDVFLVNEDGAGDTDEESPTGRVIKSVSNLLVQVTVYNAATQAMQQYAVGGLVPSRGPRMSCTSTSQKMPTTGRTSGVTSPTSSLGAGPSC